MTVYLYIIEDVITQRHYTGITNNIGRRLREHASKQSAGSRSLDDFKLIYKERFDDYKSARVREKYFKSGIGRQWIKDNLMGPANGG
jgi:putative endonuclease